jgi:hypothetical protein
MFISYKTYQFLYINAIEEAAQPIEASGHAGSPQKYLYSFEIGNHHIISQKLVYKFINQTPLILA